MATETKAPTIHLTLTGYHAGRPLCGCDKAAEETAGAEFYHWMYMSEKQLADPNVCPACKAELDAASAEE